jgi:hypothetical protein
MSKNKYKSADEALAASDRYMRKAQICLLVVVGLQVLRAIVIIVEALLR